MHIFKTKFAGSKRLSIFFQNHSLEKQFSFHIFFVDLQKLVCSMVLYPRVECKRGYFVFNQYHTVLSRIYFSILCKTTGHLLL